MFNPKRQHPILILFSIIKSLKEIIIPIGVYFVLFVFKEPSEDPILKLLPYAILALIFVSLFISAFIKWLRYTYWLEDNELRIEYGLFVKKKRYIPFERIQSLDVSENIIHRPLGLVKVKVETAGGGADEPEAELTAIRREDVDAIQSFIQETKNERKRKKDQLEVEGDILEEQESILYKITPKQLLFFASTSGQAGVIISAVIAFAAQFDEVIPYKKIFSEMTHFIKTGVTIVVIAVFLGLLLAWLVSVALAYLRYNDFTLKLVDDELIITRGLLEKRTTTIPLRRVQAVKITESLFRQPFGYAAVSIMYAGGSVIEGSSDGVIIPVIKKKHIYDALRPALPDYALELALESVPPQAKTRYWMIKLVMAVIITIAFSIWLWPYGLLAGLAIPLVFIWGSLQYKSAAWNRTGNQLTLRYRGIQQHTVHVKRNRIQALFLSENWFQRRANLASIDVSFMSNSDSSAGVNHLPREAADDLYEWFRPSKKCSSE